MTVHLVGWPWRISLSGWRRIAPFMLPDDPRWKDVVYHRSLEIGPLMLTWSRKWRP